MRALYVEDALVQPIAPDKPCGEDLEDTPLLASFDAFRVFGQSAPHDPVPEWSTIASRATEALCKSKDLRLLAYLGSAVLRTDGLAAFAETLTIASAWLETYWKETYPRIDEDAILRRNALNCFADQMAVIDGLRRLPLANHRQHGTFSLRDIEIAAGLVPADGDTPPDEARSFDPLSSQLAKIDRVLRTQLALRGDGEPEPGGDGEGGDQEGGPAISGVVRSRQDAIRA